MLRGDGVSSGFSPVLNFVAFSMALSPIHTTKLPFKYTTRQGEIIMLVITNFQPVRIMVKPQHWEQNAFILN